MYVCELVFTFPTPARINNFFQYRYSASSCSHSINSFENIMLVNPPTTKLYYAFFHDVFRLQTILLPSNLTGLVVVGLILLYIFLFRKSKANIESDKYCKFFAKTLYHT